LLSGVCFAPCSRLAAGLGAGLLCRGILNAVALPVEIKTMQT
jgi:hypothetical protein